MKPKIIDIHQWQQAELLMQPALIRLIDNLRKQLERSGWTGTYRTIEQWPEETTAEVQAKVTQLQQELEAATTEQAVAITQTLSGLPQPELIYLLGLKKQDRQLEVNVWELCYQICFDHYAASSEHLTEESQVDDSLIDPAGEVDWHRLDSKARQVVEQLFERLPPDQT